jgi:hypothetical protein
MRTSVVAGGGGRAVGSWRAQDWKRQVITFTIPAFGGDSSKRFLPETHLICLVCSHKTIRSTALDQRRRCSRWCGPDYSTCGLGSRRWRWERSSPLSLIIETR